MKKTKLETLENTIVLQAIRIGLLEEREDIMASLNDYWREKLEEAEAQVTELQNKVVELMTQMERGMDDDDAEEQVERVKTMIFEFTGVSGLDDDGSDG